jgi:3'-5' exonuclease
MNTIYFDIETSALPETELAALVPPFDPAEVKTGNIKDPEKIAAKIAEAQANHRREFFEKAALDPLTGRVLAVGVLTRTPHPDPLPSAEREETFFIIGHDDEAQTLREFWELCRGEMGRINEMVGFNTHAFDLPFLIRRSFKHRVPVPFGIRRGRYWGDEMVDLREIWQLGDRQARGSLDSIARHLGVGMKNGDGGAFAELWRSDRAKAVEYLRNDLELTAKIADALRMLA